MLPVGLVPLSVMHWDPNVSLTCTFHELLKHLASKSAFISFCLA